MEVRLHGLFAITALLVACESAVPVERLPPEPAQAPEFVDTVPADPTPSQPLTEKARVPRATWSSLLKQGRGHLKRGELASAEDSFTRAYDLARGYRDGDPRTRASYRNLERVAAAFLATGDSTSFARVMELLVFVSNEVPRARDAELARLLQDLATTRNLQKRPAEARDALLLALEILENEPGAEHASLVGIHSQLGLAHIELNELEVAEVEIDRASQIALSREDPPGPLYATSLIARARLELARSNIEAARNALTSAVDINEEQYGSEHAATARVVRELALFEQETGHHPAAEEHLDRVISIWDAIPNEHYQRAQSRNDLAWFLVEIGQPERAEAPARSALVMLEDMEVGGQPLAGIADTLATALRDQSKHEEAESLYQQALEEGAKALGLAGWDLVAIADRYATLLEQTNRSAEATELRRRWRTAVPEEPRSEAP